MTKQSRILMVSLMTAFLLAVAGASTAFAADNPFSLKSTSGTSIMQVAENKCAAGKCAAGKCGGMSSDRKSELKSMCADKIRNGFCGAGKCGAGKCGDSLKETCAKMIQGKCGEGKKESKCGAGKCGAGKCGGKG